MKHFFLSNKADNINYNRFHANLYSNDVGIIVIIERVLKMGGIMKQNVAA